MEEGIVLDRKSFEALAVGTRVELLKSLRERRKTLTELSGERGMSVSGIKEHLAVLEAAGLVRKMDDGHKWKYYELTKKGGEIIAPKELKVWILLSMSVVALLASTLAVFGALQPAAEPDAAPEMRALGAAPTADGGTAGAANGAQAPVETDAAKSLQAQNAGQEPEAQPAARPGLAVPLAVGGISAATLAACLLVLWRNRARPTR